MKFTRITVDPKEMGGVPCIWGLRIPVARVVAMVADGMTGEEILISSATNYPKRFMTQPRSCANAKRRVRCLAGNAGRDETRHIAERDRCSYLDRSPWAMVANAFRHGPVPVSLDQGSRDDSGVY